MTYRGYFAINGAEFANSSRVAAHLGKHVPQTDMEIFGPDDWCDPPVVSGGLAPIPQTAVEVNTNLYSPPDGAARVSPGLATIDRCWDHSAMCGCRMSVAVDESWIGMRDFLSDPEYHVETAPWHNELYPESAEFVGVWVTKVSGLDVTAISRKVTEMTGNGGVASIHRDGYRTITFEAVLLGCTSAGLQYGLNWLACQLSDATAEDGAVLEFLAAHPGRSAVDPASLWRESNGVVLTKHIEITDSSCGGNGRNQQATLYRVSWEMTATSPYIYRPAVDIAVAWDTITLQPVNWVHDAGCARPESCGDMPVLFSTNCTPELLPEVLSPPPVCGGCLPVGNLESFKYHLPLLDAPERCRESTVSIVFHNTGSEPLNLQGFFRPTDEDTRCEDTWFPVQINGLAPGADLYLDGITGRFYGVYEGLKRRVVGVVGTPTGAPWKPATIARYQSWDFIVQAAPNTVFTVDLLLHDQEP